MVGSLCGKYKSANRLGNFNRLGLGINLQEPIAPGVCSSVLVFSSYRLLLGSPLRFCCSILLLGSPPGFCSCMSLRIFVGLLLGSPPGFSSWVLLLGSAHRFSSWSDPGFCLWVEKQSREQRLEQHQSNLDKKKGIGYSERPEAAHGEIVHMRLASAFLAL